MNVAAATEVSRGSVGDELHRFITGLYPICRSITGDGARATLRAISERIPLRITEVASGTEVFDWTVPKEWNIRDAYIKTRGGERVVDFQRLNLHVVNYSVPVQAVMPLEELKTHLHTIPEKPDWVPYRTSYYKEDWGFCLSHNQLLGLADEDYEVSIDASLKDGHLSYGECYVPGESRDEIFVTCHICHPSLANDNLSGIAVAAFVAEQVLQMDRRRYSYRFLFAPGTIGAITWLAQNRDKVANIRHGIVLTGVGAGESFCYKKSRRGDTEMDRVAAQVLRHTGEPSEIVAFSPYGYDERQYCSPGFNLPVGCLMRSVWGTYPEYHTSADNLDFVRPEKLEGSLRVVRDIVDTLERNRSYRNLQPFCEPQLGKRNLYPSGGGKAPGEEITARLWVLNCSDGEHSLLDIAERSGMSFAAIHEAAQALCNGGLLSPI